MSQRNLNAYRSVQATSCNPAGLLLMVYDKTMGEIQKAILLHEGGQRSFAWNNALMKASLGVMELDKTLNFNVLPELADSLHNLYLHILLLLGDGLQDSTVEPLKRAHYLLSQLRETWNQASKKAPGAEAV